MGEPLPGWRPPLGPSEQPMVGRYCRVERLSVEAHGEALWAANSADGEGRMWRYLPYGPFTGAEAYRAWLGSVAGLADPMFFALVPVGLGRAVGLASYLRVDRPNGVIEVGHLAYSPPMQRTPVGTEAMFLMMERAFAAGYRRYEWKCHALNHPSRKAAQRLGFSYEGTFRQAAVVKGRSRDTAWFSVIDGEWPRLRAAFVRWLDPENFDGEGRQRVALGALTRPLLGAVDPGLGWGGGGGCG